MDEARLPQLRKYVVEARNRGETYDAIRQELRSAGWRDAEINACLTGDWRDAGTASAPAPEEPLLLLADGTLMTAVAPLAISAYPHVDRVNNTSGDRHAPVPPEVAVMGWSWGGFGLSWIWGVGNGVYLALLALIPRVGGIVAIWMGFSGHRMAWQARRYASFEQFQETQEVWDYWGRLLFFVGVALLIVILIVSLFTSHNQPGG